MRYILGFVLCASAFGQSINEGSYNALRAGGWGYKQQDTSVYNDGINKIWVWSFIAPSATSVSSFSFYTQTEYGTVAALVIEILETQRYRDSSPFRVVTWSDADDWVSLTSHQFANGDAVRFGGGTAPAGVTLHTTYYVCNAATDTFQIDDDSGCGSIVTDFSGASGTTTVRKLISLSTTVSPAVGTGVTSTFSSFSAHTLTANRMYHILMWNNAAANYIRRYTQYTASSSYQHGSANPAIGPVAALPSDFQELYSTDFGNAFTSYGPGQGWVAELASGDLIGNPNYAIAAVASGERVYGSQELGVKFKTPETIKLRVRGAWFTYYTIGTPGGELGTKLYQVGSTTDTLLASAQSYRTIYSQDATNNIDYGIVFTWFSATQELAADTFHRLAMYGSGGDSSNAYGAWQWTIWDDDRGRKLLPFARGVAANGAVKSTCTGTCTTTANWTNSTTVTLDTWGLILETGSPYAGGASGGTYGFGHAH